MAEPDPSVPELVGGVDIRNLPLTAVDGFVLSRIDGHASTAEIVSMTGLGAEQVHAILARLAELGAIRFRARASAPVRTPASPAQSSPGHAPASANSPRNAPVAQSSPGHAPPTPSSRQPAREPTHAAPGQAPPVHARPQQAPPARAFAPQTPPPQSPFLQTPPPRTSPPQTTPPQTSPSRTPPPRSSASLPPFSSSVPPRRRSSRSPMPRRMMSESSISASPPDMRSIPPRVRGSTPARGRTPVPASATSPSKAPSVSAELSTPRVLGAPSGASTPPSRASVAAPADNEGEARARSPFERSSLRVEPPRSARPAPPYDPRELEEQVDLPLERRKQVLDLYHRLGQLDYYEVLGVSYGAEKKEIRAAYFSGSKIFHTDSMFRKELGSFKAKMTAVFQAMTEAYDVLSRKKSREEYDVYLRSTRSIKDAERALATEDVAQADINVAVPRPPPLPSTDYELPPPTPVPVDARAGARERNDADARAGARERNDADARAGARERDDVDARAGARERNDAEASPEARERNTVAPRVPSPEARRIARELLERRLRGLPQSSARRGEAPRAPEPDNPPEASSLPPAAPVDRRELARQLTRTLIDVSKLTGSSDKLTRAIDGARAAFERGDLAESVQYMARAFSIAPERVDLHAEYERLSRMLAEKLADDYIEQARFEAKQGKWAAAALSWAKVCEGRPDDTTVHRHAAFALLKAGGDVRGAQKYAQRAVFLAPDDVDARILLAQVYLTVGLKLNARRELDAAAKLDPENEMVKNLLSDLKA